MLLTRPPPLAHPVDRDRPPPTRGYPTDPERHSARPMDRDWPPPRGLGDGYSHEPHWNGAQLRDEARYRSAAQQRDPPRTAEGPYRHDGFRVDTRADAPRACAHRAEAYRPVGNEGDAEFRRGEAPRLDSFRGDAFRAEPYRPNAMKGDSREPRRQDMGYSSHNGAPARADARTDHRNGYTAAYAPHGNEHADFSQRPLRRDELPEAFPYAKRDSGLPGRHPDHPPGE